MYFSDKLTKGTALIGMSATLIGTAAAQAVSTSVAENQWFFSTGNTLSNYQVQPNPYSIGESVYNLLNSSDSVASGQTGTGSAYSLVSDASVYEQQIYGVGGDNKVYAQATSGLAGGGEASAGSMETVVLASFSDAPFTLDIQSTVYITAQLGAGIDYDSSLTSGGGMTITSDKGSYTGDVAFDGDYWGGINLEGTGDYTYSGMYYPNTYIYTWNYQLEMNPGDVDTVSFFTATLNEAEGAAAATPSPSSCSTMLVGLTGLFLFRRRRKAKA